MKKEITYFGTINTLKSKCKQPKSCHWGCNLLNLLLAGSRNTGQLKNNKLFSLHFSFAPIKSHFNYSFKKNSWDFAFSNDGMFSRNFRILVAPLLAEEGDPSTSYLSLSRNDFSEYLFDTVRGISSVQKGNSNIITYSVIGRKPA